MTIDVHKVANLADLDLTEAELAKYEQQLSTVLDYVDQLKLVDTEKVEPVYNITNKSSVFAPDEIKPSLDSEAALQNAPHSENGFFVTKGVFADE